VLFVWANLTRGSPSLGRARPPRRGFKCALTGIYVIRHIKAVESSFAILAEPNRRAILGMLATSELSVGELERGLHMPQTSVSKHLRVLREAGFVEARVDAQRRVYRICPKPLQEVDAWLAPFRRYWESHVDALARHLDRMSARPIEEDRAPRRAPTHPNKTHRASRRKKDR